MSDRPVIDVKKRKVTEVPFRELRVGWFYVHRATPNDIKFLFRLFRVVDNARLVTGQMLLGNVWRDWMLSTDAGTMLYELTDEDHVRWRDKLG